MRIIYIYEPRGGARIDSSRVAVAWWRGGGRRGRRRMPAELTGLRGPAEESRPKSLSILLLLFSSRLSSSTDTNKYITYMYTYTYYVTSKRLTVKSNRITTT